MNHWLSFIKRTTASLAVVLCSVSLAWAQEVTVGVGSVSGQPGSVVDVEIFFLGNDDARTYNFDITVDLTQVEGGSAGIDVSACLESAPTLPIENCVVRDAPNDDTVRVGQAGFTDPLPDINPIGVIRYTIDAGAAEGDVINLTISEFDVENVDPANVELIHGQIEVVLGPPGVLTVTPDPLAFGTITTGTTSTMSATATADAAGGDVNLTSAALNVGAEFTIVGGSCDPFPTLLNPGDSCTIDIEFAPGAEGNFSDELCVDSDAGTECIDVTGAATDGPPPADPVFGITPPPGPVNLGSGDAGDLLTVAGSVTNNGEADLDFNCTIVDDGGGVFSLIPDPFGGTLGEGESDAFELTCALPGGAAEGDSFSGAMECTSNDPTAPTTTHTLACAVGQEPAEPPAVIPTMQTWGLALLALLMLMIGAFSIRIFRS